MTEPTIAVPLPPRYRFRAIVGKGSSTAVYRVEDLAERREVAMKVLMQEDWAPEEVLQFKSEVRMLASLTHPNIVDVYDYGLLEDGYPYFTMEYISGKKISDWFDGTDWDALYNVILQIALGLHHVHHFGIVHFDLKPSNILVTAEGHVKLMDFGVAAEANRLFDRRIRGTLHYMAPEILRQEKIDGRADLYGLGMTLYETVTGALPTYGLPQIEILRTHLEGSFRRPSAINPNLPRRFERVILKLLERDPRNRYSSAAALVHEIAELAGVTDPAAELLGRAGELLAAPLVGRSQELERLMAGFQGAKESRGGGILLMGPEGMGKSRILQDATLRVQLDGGRVFCGRCTRERRSIYAPFLEIFRQMLEAVNPEADASEEMRRILRPVSTERARQPMRGQKFRLFHRVVQSIHDFHGLLNAGTESRSALMLIVEDLQWADPATAELFTFLVGEAKHTNLLVVGTLNTDAPDAITASEGEGSAVEEWQQRARDTAMEVVTIGELSEDSVREYVEALLGREDLSPELIRWIFWESGGSPLNVRRIIEYLISHNYLQWSVEAWIADMEGIHTLRIPGGAGAIWTEKIRRLDPVELEVLQTGALLGERFSTDLLARVMDRPAEEVYLVLRRLVSLQLLDAAGGQFSFPQRSLREIVYNSYPEPARAVTHRKAGHALEEGDQEGEHLGTLAYHFSRSDDPRAGIEYSIRAADLAVAALAHDQAAELYRAALELMDLSGEEERKLEIREKLGDAYESGHNDRSALQVYQFLLKSIQRDVSPEAELRAAGIMKKIGRVLTRRSEYDAALSYFETCREIYRRAGRVMEVAEMLNRAAHVCRSKGDATVAERLAHEAEQLVSGEPLAPIHGYIHNTLGLLAIGRGDWQSARESFARVLEVAETVDSSALRKLGTTHLGVTLWKLGEWEEALSCYRKNLEEAERDGDLWDLVNATHHLAVIEFSRGHFSAAASYFEKTLRIDEKLASPEHEATARKHLGEALEMLGNWSEALNHYSRCLEIEGFDESRPSRVSVYIPLARLTAKTGDIPKAARLAQKALDAGVRSRDDDLMAEAAFLLAEIELQRERFDQAAAYLDQARSLFESGATAHGRARVSLRSADLQIRRQELDQAAGNLAVAREIAERLGDEYSLAHVGWLEGKLLFFRGEREAAEESFAEAERILEDLDTPYDQARMLFELGLLREDAEPAGRAIRKASAMFEKLGASLDLERARGVLYRIRPGARPAAKSVVGLYEIVKIINSTLSVAEVLDRVLDLALQRLRAERGMIILIDPITTALRTRVVRNIREGGEEETIRSPQWIVREVVRTGQSLISADARADDRFLDSETVIVENIVSTLCVPLVIRERIAGAIYVDHRETRHLFAERDLHFLEAFADQAAIAIENARLYEELEEARMRLTVENETLRTDALTEKHLDSIVGHSEPVARIQFTMKKAASSNSTVLIRGESGTGKGLVARIVHNISARRRGPFIKFNCAALPETLAESELFGHEKGAFTGADRRKPGRFELADGGTILLDEIGKISLAMQAKLLRVVEDKEFERVGGTQTIKVDVKIIAATNLDLERAMEEGSFREDLYYRLNIIPIVIPPLRERKEDIPDLVEHFIRGICRDLGVEIKHLEPGILEVLEGYDWPGNVRELEATLHRAIVMSNGAMLTRGDFLSLLPDPSRAPTSPEQPGILPSEVLHPVVRRLPMNESLYADLMARADRQLIEQTLQETGGKIRETARRLGLARNTLKSKIDRYRIRVDDVSGS